MSLHDVSKDDNKRLDPKANASDARAQRDATNTTSIHPVTDATTTKGFLQTGSGRIVGNDGTNNVGLFGFDSTGTMVVKVAKPGFDADTAASSNLIFNSAQNTFKIVATGSTTFNLSNTTQNISIAHGLSFTPTVVAHVDATFNGVAQGLTAAPALVLGTNSGVGGNYVVTAFAYVRGSDATNIKFFVGVTAVSYSGTIYYYILQETATAS